MDYDKIIKLFEQMKRAERYAGNLLDIDVYSAGCHVEFVTEDTTYSSPLRDKVMCQDLLRELKEQCNTDYLEAVTALEKLGVTIDNSK